MIIVRATSCYGWPILRAQMDTMSVVVVVVVVAQWAW